MSTVRFENGIRVNFDGNPTQSDIEEMATKLGIGQTKIPVQPKPLPEPSGTGGIVTDALKTLVVKPAVRLGQAIGTPIARALGASDEGIQKAIEMPVFLPIGKSGYGINVEPQKAIGEGGATQIFSDALKSATYLAPYGRIAGAGIKGATALGLGKGASRIAGGILAGATGGYGVDVSQSLDQGDSGKAFIPGFATLVGGVTGGLLEGGVVGLEKATQRAQTLSKELEQETFKLTPAQKTKLGSKLDEITDFSTKNIPAGKPEERLAYADDLYEHFEEQLQKGLEQKTIDPTVIEFKTGKPRITPTYTVNKQTLINQFNSIKGAYKYDRDAEAIYKQIDGAINTIKNQYKGEQIPVDKLNIFKRSTYQNAYNKAGDKVMDFVEHDIGDVTRIAIERATKGLRIAGKSVGEFNREYGNLIQLRKILKTASGRPELNFTKRIVARIIGGILGHALGGFAGLLGGELVAEPIANKVAGTATKTGVAKNLMNIKPKQIGSVIQRLRP
jgi:hypothetical protein